LLVVVFALPMFVVVVLVLAVMSEPVKPEMVSRF
jgi:hypothetical protein